MQIRSLAVVYSISQVSNLKAGLTVVISVEDEVKKREYWARTFGILPADGRRTGYQLVLCVDRHSLPEQQYPVYDR
jgi:hypothetical protein